MKEPTIVFHYKNRRGDSYYLHQGITKTGNPKYYFSMKKKDNTLVSIPEGFEIYENPNAQVFLVKKELPLITTEEKQIIVNAMNKNQEVEYFFIDVRKKYVTIYIAEQDSIISETYSIFSTLNRTTNLQRLLHYEAQMRFELINENQRYFIAERFCYRGSVNRWITISSADTLGRLIDKFLPHLGQETFYDLFPF